MHSSREGSLPGSVCVCVCETVSLPLPLLLGFCELFPAAACQLYPPLHLLHAAARVASSLRLPSAKNSTQLNSERVDPPVNYLWLVSICFSWNCVFFFGKFPFTFSFFFSLDAVYQLLRFLFASKKKAWVIIIIIIKKTWPYHSQNFVVIMFNVFFCLQFFIVVFAVDFPFFFSLLFPTGFSSV